jgi:hypothetical protein
MDQICFRSDYFIVFVIITFVIIGWVLYHCHRTTEQLRTIYTDLDNLVSEQKDNPSPVQPQPQLPPQLIQQVPPQPQLMPNYPVMYNSITQGLYGNYQLVGYVSSPKQPNHMFRLMGRQIYSNKYEYYVIHPYTDIKIPIDVKNNWELNTGDRISIPGFGGHYIVNVYDSDRTF